MDLDDIHRSLTSTLRGVREAQSRQGDRIDRAQARFEELLEVLVGREVITAGHRRLIERVGAAAGQGERPRVRLRTYVDKYQVANADIDCAARLPLCRARCCSFAFELSAQDLDEGKIRWQLDDPYVIRHDDDGYCSHFDRRACGCTVYENRPAPCRSYDCRQDRRVWIDFEQRLAAPFPEGVVPPPPPGI